MAATVLPDRVGRPGGTHAASAPRPAADPLDPGALPVLAISAPNPHRARAARHPAGRLGRLSAADPARGARHRDGGHPGSCGGTPASALRLIPWMDGRWARVPRDDLPALVAAGVPAAEHLSAFRSGSVSALGASCVLRVLCRVRLHLGDRYCACVDPSVAAPERVDEDAAGRGCSKGDDMNASRLEPCCPAGHCPSGRWLRRRVWRARIQRRARCSRLRPPAEARARRCDDEHRPVRSRPARSSGQHHAGASGTEHARRACVEVDPRNRGSPQRGIVSWSSARPAARCTARPGRRLARHPAAAAIEAAAGDSRPACRTLKSPTRLSRNRDDARTPRAAARRAREGTPGCARCPLASKACVR